MKQTSFTQHFKVTKNSTNPDQIGKKRDSIAVQYQEIEPIDVSELIQSEVSLILNNAIETYAKKLMLSNGADWDYVPAESDLTVSAVFADLTAERRGGGNRILTKESLASFATHYAELAVSFLGKSKNGANSGAMIINERLKPILGNDIALNTFMDNLTQLLDCQEFDETHAPVVEALLELIADAAKTEIDMDAL